MKHNISGKRFDRLKDYCTSKDGVNWHTVINQALDEFLEKNTQDNVKEGEQYETESFPKK